MTHPLALNRFALAAFRTHPDKLARTREAASHDAVRAVLAGSHAASSAAGSPLVPFLVPRFDQGQSGGCTAHGKAGATGTRNAYLGAPSVPSPRGYYGRTRAWARGLAAPLGALPALTDSGAELGDVIASEAVFGVDPYDGKLTPDGRRSDLWTPDDIAGIDGAPPANVNDEPDGLSLEVAASDPLSGAYTVDPAASDAVTTAVAALKAAYPLYVGFYCDSSFQALGAGNVASAPDQSLSGGGHAVFLADFRPSATASGTTEMLLVNSWGEGWAGDGTVWVSEAFFRSLWEVWIVDEVVTGKAAA